MVSVLIENRRLRVAEIRRGIKEATEAGRDVNARKFIIEIMRVYGVSRRTATEYYNTADDLENGDKYLEAKEEDSFDMGAITVDESEG